LRRHLAKAKTGKLEQAEIAAGTAGKLTAVAQSDARRILRQFIQSVYGSESVLFALVHVEDRSLERLALLPLELYQLLSFSLLCDRRFCCHCIPLLLAGRTLLALFAVGVFLVDNIYAASAAHDLISFGGIGLNRSSNFHRRLTI
jgi:hypothetical protein